jgi:hypothetical protein
LSEFKANSVSDPLNSGHINRIVIIGWMREFEVDISLAKISLYISYTSKGQFN